MFSTWQPVSADSVQVKKTDYPKDVHSETFSMDLKDPENLKADTAVYDEKSGYYKVGTKLGDDFLSQPWMMTPEEYLKWSEKKSFWDHLDELRTCLIRIIIVVLAGAIVAFAMKTEVFSIVLAPTKSEFITYRWFSQFGEIADFNLNLINTQLTSQFSVHMQVSIMIGIICVCPYILYSIFAFVSPALYENERKYARLLVVAGYIMFMIGVALCYFLIFPLTIRFLGNYHVSDDVANIITLSSYIDTLTMLTLMLGIVFELPILCMLLGKMGILTADFMKEYRRHAIVIILIVAAIITPTTDVMTLMLVTLPIYLLYEISILAVKMINK
mgnify:CR=1 FL=1